MTQAKSKYAASYNCQHLCFYDGETADRVMYKNVYLMIF